MSNLISVKGKAIIDLDTVESIQPMETSLTRNECVRITFLSGRVIEIKGVDFNDFVKNLVGTEDEGENK